MENRMNVVLVHPTHGAKVATHEKELEDDEKNGWTRYNQPVADEVVPVKPKPVRKAKQTTIEQPNEVPDFLAPVSDESEGN
jgi:hypothetical protein